MKTIVRHALMFIVCMICAMAQDLDSLHRSFMTKYDQINTNRDAKVEALTEGYLSALDRLKKQLQTTGQLELVLQAQYEIDVMGKDVWPPEVLGENATSELKSLRMKYVEAREKVHKEHAVQLNEVVDKMDKLLATQIVDLTKAGKIEQAKLAQKMKDDLAKDAAILAARESLQVGDQQNLGQWINLWELKPKWNERQLINGVEFKGHPDLRLDAKQLEEIVYAHASSRFEYNFKQSVSQLRCGLWLPNSGDVIFIIKADGGEVFRKQISGPTKEVFPVDIQFKSAKNIEFITDKNGAENFDWSTWIKPQVK
jgi:hypothetical protein